MALLFHHQQVDNPATTDSSQQIEALRNLMDILYQDLQNYPRIPTITTSQNIFSDLNRAMSILKFLTSIGGVQQSQIRKNLGGNSVIIQLLSRQPAKLIRPIIRFVAVMKNSTNTEWEDFLTTLGSKNSVQAYGSLMQMMIQENQKQQQMHSLVRAMASLLERLQSTEGCDIGPALAL